MCDEIDSKLPSDRMSATVRAIRCAPSVQALDDFLQFRNREHPHYPLWVEEADRRRKELIASSPADQKLVELFNRQSKIIDEMDRAIEGLREIVDRLRMPPWIVSPTADLRAAKDEDENLLSLRMLDGIPTDQTQF